MTLGLIQHCFQLAILILQLDILILQVLLGSLVGRNDMLI